VASPPGGRCMASFPLALTPTPTLALTRPQVAFSPDGRYMASCGNDSMAFTYSVTRL